MSFTISRKLLITDHFIHPHISLVWYSSCKARL